MQRERGMIDLKRHGVSVTGNGQQAIVFLHGYGCDSDMWRDVVPAFDADYRVISYDLVGYGRSDATLYDPIRYACLQAYAEDLIDILEALKCENVIAVGHSVSAMIIGLAATRRPDLISRLVMVCPSPSFANDEGYEGGFERQELLGLLDILDVNFMGWAQQMAPKIMNAPHRPELSDALTDSFCRTDPDIAKHFAKVTFLQDHREDVKLIKQPTLLLQCHDDVLVPPAVRTWMERNMYDAKLQVLDTTGHCPHISAPAPTVAAIHNFLRSAVAA